MARTEFLGERAEGTASDAPGFGERRHRAPAGPVLLPEEARTAGSRQDATVTTATVAATTAPSWGAWMAAGVRGSLAFVFLWAFFDKLLGLGFATPPARAWLAGGSPTRGFLLNGTHGPLAGFYQALAGNPVVDAVFMVGLLAIGAALALGIGMRVAAASGAAMMLLMYTAAMPPTNNPLVDDHVVYALVLLLLPSTAAARTFGLGEWWARQPVVQRHPWMA
jgi:thiosulfate dehydrogenase (quinone) large subunit